MSLFSITSLSTTLCYKVKLDNYNKDNINEKTYIKTDSNIKYYYSNNNNINISKDIAASNLVNCIENQLNLESLNDTIKSTINNLQNLYNEKDEYFSFIYKDIYTGYTVSYNENLRLPNWVTYELTRQETQGNAQRTDRFIADPQVKGVIATNADYTRSGYDKGHMAPAADMKWSVTAMKESFYFSNMCPQHPELNRRKWKDLEEKIRDWAITDSAIIIICGPIVEDSAQKIGKNRVVVPQKFFKVILSPFVDNPRAIGFLFDNERSVEPLGTYVVSVDSIETLTGMDFFAPLPDELEDSIEAKADIRLWK